jgi:transposase
VSRLPASTETALLSPGSAPIACYLGLVPLEDSSGDRRRLGHITKQGNSLLRFLLVEAAQMTVRSEGYAAAVCSSNRREESPL